MLLIGNGRLITHNPAEPYYENGCVAVDGNVITGFGATADIRAEYPKAELYDAGGMVIMPGLINTHTHIYSAFARGMSLNQPRPNKNFQEILENLWWRLDKALNLEDVKYSAYATYIECIKSGVTTVFDHHASQRHVEGSLMTIADAAKELGVRASLCYETSDRDGGETMRLALKENAGFIRFAQSDTTDMIKGMFGLHASFTLSDETLALCAEAMGKMKAGYHVHVAEDPGDLDDALKKYGKRVVRRLFDAGVLGEKTIAVHCIHIDGDEMDILKETNTLVAHNPESNMGNAVGCADVLGLMEKGVTVGLGTDGYTSDMLESMKAANLIHKHDLRDPSAAWAETPRMLFDNNGIIAGRFFEKPIGIIDAGAYADIIVVDYDPHTPMDTGNISGHILFGMSGRGVVSTMINGRFVMRDRRLINADEREITAKSREAAGALWKRLNGQGAQA